MTRRFDTLLVANRGEIALRILRTARRLGLRTVAVYSDADRHSPHLAHADLACRLGPAPARESYLCIERLIDAALASGAQAVHPGYGFLAENASFAAAVQAAGLVFVGPPAQAIELMGNKAAAKVRMAAAGMPCIAGWQGGADEVPDDAALVREAMRIGFPVMVKAAAGGGGRGMRRVAKADDLPEALAMARSEAMAAFGSGQLILERAIDQARHIEIQVFADEHGSVIHLGERDCSVQRRHQKLIEEAPSPAVDAALREAMGAVAVAATRAIGYRGAGTLEFLLEPDGRFWFMEMNTRLQVEHGVTELVTGLDLVEWQLRVAQGEPLPLTQDQVRWQGHAMELRLCAEDPSRDFLPQLGEVLAWEAPPGVRADAALAAGVVVAPDYDSMLGKVMAHGASRAECIDRLVAAAQRTVLLGVRHNLAFLTACLRDPVFAEGGASTTFIERRFPGPRPPGTAAAAGGSPGRGSAVLAGRKRGRLDQCARSGRAGRARIAGHGPHRISGDARMGRRDARPGRGDARADDRDARAVRAGDAAGRWTRGRARAGAPPGAAGRSAELRARRNDPSGPVRVRGRWGAVAACARVPVRVSR
ncbi:MAG: ATP-grasp domain-containing protein [Burkholderiaceae bacterium]|nr:ATP-grasp domain-containing protein [Burkholderiaceae bacterium]